MTACQVFFIYSLFFGGEYVYRAVHTVCTYVPEVPELADVLLDPGMLRVEGKKNNLLAGSERFL